MPLHLVKLASKTNENNMCPCGQCTHFKTLATGTSSRIFHPLPPTWHRHENNLDQYHDLPEQNPESCQVLLLLLYRHSVTYHQRYPTLIIVDESPLPPAHEIHCSHKVASHCVEPLTRLPPFSATQDYYCSCGKGSKPRYIKNQHKAKQIIF